MGRVPPAGYYWYHLWKAHRTRLPGLVSSTHSCGDDYVQGDAEYCEELEGGSFMGYFGPIGIGAVFYVEHTRHLYPKVEAAETIEEEDLLRAMGPVVYFLVLFSIVVHGLSIPALDIIYRWRKVEPIVEMEPVMIHRLSVHNALPNNAHVDPVHDSVVQHNRFSRAVNSDAVNFDILQKRFGQQERVSLPPPPAPPVQPISAARLFDARDDGFRSYEPEK